MVVARSERTRSQRGESSLQRNDSLSPISHREGCLLSGFVRSSPVSPKDVWEPFHPFSLRIIQSLLKSTHYNLLTVLACSFPCGYAGVKYLFVMPRSQQYLLKAFLSNCSPLSEMRVRGILNRTTIFFPSKSLCIRIPDICQWFSFNPFNEVIYADQQISFIPCYLRERTYNVQTPLSKRPRAG